MMRTGVPPDGDKGISLIQIRGLVGLWRTSASGIQGIRCFEMQSDGLTTWCGFYPVRGSCLKDCRGCTLTQAVVRRCFLPHWLEGLYGRVESRYCRARNQA